MNYKIYSDNYLLYDSNNENYVLTDIKLTQEVNKVDELSFKIYPNHTNYNHIQKLTSVITVTKENEVIFRGRALNDNQDFNNVKQITCESHLAYLFDSIIRPFHFPGDEQFTGAKDAANPVEFFLKWIIDTHNSQVNDSQKILLGTVTVTDLTDKNSTDAVHKLLSYGRSSIEFLTSHEIIKTRILDSLGGYLRIRYAEGGTYLDYIEDFTDTGYSTGLKLTCSQTIEFGENLLNVAKTLKGEEIKTGIIPLGDKLTDAEGNETDEYLTIKEIVDGEVVQDIIKQDDYILHTGLAAQYGKIFDVVKFDGIRTAQTLKAKALEHIANSTKYSVNLELKAIDLRLTTDQVGTFKVGQYVKCKSEPHGLNELYLLKKIQFDFLNPQNTTITIGNSFLSLTDVQLGEKAIQDDLTERVDKVERGYLINGTVAEIIDKHIENSSAIEQSSEQIMSTITKTYTTKTEFEEYKEQTDTKFIQTSDSFEMKFTSVQELINTVSDNLSTNYNQLTKYIRFTDGNIILGEVDSDLVLRISNDRISFLQNDIEVAYISNKKMYITKGEFIESLIIGTFAFVPRSNGNLSFKKMR